MERVNPIVNGAYFSMRDIYGNSFGISTHEQTAPEPEEQSALANQETVAPNPKNQNHMGILTWLGIIIVFVILFQFGGGK